MKMNYSIMYHMKEEDKISKQLEQLVYNTYVTKDREVKIVGTNYTDEIDILEDYKDKYTDRELDIWLELVQETIEETGWGMSI